MPHSALFPELIPTGVVTDNETDSEIPFCALTLHDGGDLHFLASNGKEYFMHGIKPGTYFVAPVLRVFTRGTSPGRITGWFEPPAYEEMAIIWTDDVTDILIWDDDPENIIIWRSELCQPVV